MTTPHTAVYLFDPERGVRVPIPTRVQRPGPPVHLTEAQRQLWEKIKAL